MQVTVVQPVSGPASNEQNWGIAQWASLAQTAQS